MGKSPAGGSDGIFSRKRRKIRRASFQKKNRTFCQIAANQTAVLHEMTIKVGFNWWMNCV
jgi:hypothetical protein